MVGGFGGRVKGPIRLVCIVAAGAMAAGSASCPKKMSFSLDTKFSVNLVRPSPTWPKLEKLSLAQLEVYEKYGRPDYFRIWYNPRGEIVTAREAGPIIRAKRLGELPRSWVYENKKIEVRFTSPSKYEELPLSDQLKVLCLRGDPQERDVQTLKGGIVRESWTYFDVGEKYFFIDGHISKKQVFKGVGRPFERM